MSTLIIIPINIDIYYFMFFLLDILRLINYYIFLLITFLSFRPLLAIFKSQNIIVYV
jgi:hypothetical protein